MNNTWFNTISLRTRIFLAMLSLVIITSILVVIVTMRQYQLETQTFHRQRLIRTEKHLKIAIYNTLRSSTYPINSMNVPLIFRERSRIYHIAQEHSLPLNIYSLEGKLLLQSNVSITGTTTLDWIPQMILDTLPRSLNKRYLESIHKGDEEYLSSYTYINDIRGKPLAILHIPYLQDQKISYKQLNIFLERLILLYLLMFVLAVILAYLLSRYIAKSLQDISDKIHTTTFDKTNQQIPIQEVEIEIRPLVLAYNQMVVDLEKNALYLAKSERKAAWREMAKQVAHEIKNPLTPMRLMVQNFSRRFNPEDPKIYDKLNEYSSTMIQQIDTLTTIATAFSDFAKMPTQCLETLDINHELEMILKLYDSYNIELSLPKEHIYTSFDSNQFTRIITNLIKNALESVVDQSTAEIKVSLSKIDTNDIQISIQDNGIGIPKENQSRIFEPKFTSKSKGTGLGLAMVKQIIDSYDGDISFETSSENGTTFFIIFPQKL